MTYVSVSFYQNTECANNNLINFLHFLDLSTKIVVHIKENSEIQAKDLIRNERIIVNPSSVRTSRANSLPAHVSNFLLVEKDVSKFCIMSPADLFFRHGFEKYVELFDVGISNTSGRIPQRISDQYCREAFGGSTVSATQSEGSFYRSDIFKKICEFFINKNFMFEIEDKDPKKVPSTVESVPATIVRDLEDFSRLKVGEPFTYSTAALRRSNFTSKLEISLQELSSVISSKEISCYDKFCETNKILNMENIFAIRRFAYISDDRARKFMEELISK